MELTEITRIRDQELLSGLIRIHILYHACKGPIFGLGMIEELHRHGYKISAGTLYPMLHGLERRGLLRSEKIRLGRRGRRIYRATTAGRRTLAKAKTKVKLLLGELVERNPIKAQEDAESIREPECNHFIRRGEKS